MKIEITRLNKAVHLKATNGEGLSVILDGSPAVGGEQAGMRPMQLLLSALGSCSAIDVIDVLKKQRQDLEDIKITVDGEREDKPAPAVFTRINVHFTLYGRIQKEKAERAIDLSINKYCSVARMLEKTAEITYSFEIIAQ
ncbi:MAG: OsmC family protein [Candidatus Cyclobacteriaceae bacterium M3_2C_046]